MAPPTLIPRLSVRETEVIWLRLAEDQTSTVVGSAGGTGIRVLGEGFYCIDISSPWSLLKYPCHLGHS